MKGEPLWQGVHLVTESATGYRLMDYPYNVKGLTADNYKDNL